MKRLQRPYETGATLVVSLIMLTLITLMIMAALAIGGANFRTVTNMQFRDEAVAAANRAIDQVVSSPFALDPPAAVETIHGRPRQRRHDGLRSRYRRAPMPSRHDRRDHFAEQHLAAAGDGNRVVVEHGLGDPSHSYGRQRRRSCSGRAHGRARAAEPGAEGRGVHMKRKYKLDRHDQTPPGNRPGNGAGSGRRGAVPATCRGRRHRPVHSAALCHERHAERADPPRQHGELEYGVHQRDCCARRDGQQPAGERRRQPRYSGSA